MCRGLDGAGDGGKDPNEVEEHDGNKGADEDDAGPLVAGELSANVFPIERGQAKRGGREEEKDK